MASQSHGWASPHQRVEIPTPVQRHGPDVNARPIPRKLHHPEGWKLVVSARAYYGQPPQQLPPRHDQGLNQIYRPCAFRHELRCEVQA